MSDTIISRKLERGRVGWGKTILGQLMRFERMGISVVRPPLRRNITHYGFPVYQLTANVSVDCEIQASSLVNVFL